MNKIEYAKDLFAGDLNCAQSVLSAFSPELDMDVNTLQKLGSNFGGGMGEGEICGTVTAALMILGLKFGTDQNSASDKGKTIEASELFKTKFIEKFESLDCKELIGYNVKVPEEEQKAIESNVFKTKCPLLVAGSIEVLDSILD